MLKHTRKIKDLYEDIQKKLFYMIPEKWDKLFLYSSILDKPDKEGRTGELFFYYMPKGILRKKVVNVYEIPSRFNVDEKQYLKLVEILYSEIKELRKEFMKVNEGKIWTNLTMSIQNLRFKVEYDYTDLNNFEFDSFQRHIIWRYENLGIGLEQLNKGEREIIKQYYSEDIPKGRKEYYEAGIYIRDIENMVAYSTDNYDDNTENNEEDEKSNRNQILFSKGFSNKKDDKK